jgi:hypothetical protein
MSKYILPRLRDSLFLSLFFAVIAFGPRTFNLDGDIGRHITIGNYILNQGSIPLKDIFSHTKSGLPLTPHEWMAQALFALAHRGLNMGGVVLLAAVLISTTFTIVYYDSLERSKAPILSIAIVFLAAASSSLHWLARPHLFTLLYLSLWSLLLERKWRGERITPWHFGGVMLVWANTHGAFIAGFFSWGAYLAAAILESWRTRSKLKTALETWSVIGAVSFIATLMNPAGIRLWQTSLSFISNRYLVTHTQEYLPPDFQTLNALPFLILIALSLLLLINKSKSLPLHHGFLLAGWTTMGLISARNIPLFAIVAAPILSQTAIEVLRNSPWGKKEEKFLEIEQGLKGMAWLTLGVLIGAFLMLTPAFQKFNTFDESGFPINAVNWLSDHPQNGQVFNYFPWGGYLLYRKWPETVVFIDGQTDFYGEELTREYECVISGKNGWEQILDKYSVSWVIIPDSSSLAIILKTHSGWTIRYEDATTMIASSDP